MKSQCTLYVNYMDGSDGVYDSLELPEIKKGYIRIVGKDKEGVFDRYLILNNIKHFKVSRANEREIE